MPVVKEISVEIPEHENITVYDIGYDVNGNRRYVVHFISLDIKLEDYGRIGGLKKYRAKWFGGGYIFQSVNLKHDLTFMLNLVKEYYQQKQ